MPLLSGQRTQLSTTQNRALGNNEMSKIRLGLTELFPKFTSYPPFSTGLEGGGVRQRGICPQKPAPMNKGSFS